MFTFWEQWRVNVDGYSSTLWATVAIFSAERTARERERFVFPVGSKKIEKDRNWGIGKDRTFLSLSTHHFASPKLYFFKNLHLSRVTGNIYLFLSLCLVIFIFSYLLVYPTIEVLDLQPNSCGFFQNLNVYLRKTCTIVLFKVLPTWSYDFFPSFCQFVDSIPKELRRLGGQEWIKSIFNTLFWCEPYSSEGVLHRPEQMVVRRGKVRAIRRMG